MVESSINLEGRKCAFIAYTPFHLLNAISFVLTHNIKNTDIFIVHEFNAFDDIEEKIKDSGIFNNVYFTSSQHLHRRENLWTLIGMVSPITFTEHLFGKGSFKNRHYDCLFFGISTRVVELFLNSDKEAAVYAYDDGLGSYYEDRYSKPFIKTGNSFVRKMYFLLRKVFGIESRIPKCIFLNNPDYYYGSDVYPTAPLLTRTLDSNERKLISIIFSYNPPSAYKDKRIIYLNQPITELGSSDYISNELNIIRCLDRHSTIIKLHPRENHTNQYDGFQIDSMTMWELLCMDTISDDSTLISWYSTALFTPKMIYNKEPTVIFTYKLFPEIPISEGMKEFSNLLKDKYDDPSKVIVVNDLDEFKRILHSKESSSQA